MNMDENQNWQGDCMMNSTFLSLEIIVDSPLIVTSRVCNIL